MFWLIVAIVVSLSIGFVMGATFRQYRPIKISKPHIRAEDAVAEVQRERARQLSLKWRDYFSANRF